ncbi:MAG: 7-cyano-7-deazaguanine synthase QueC [Myxococcales bacterium]|jgi:7-cyano-7-deazaguanine synthase|nr:7-cyano-7-deazaguanine synthase QueC [Myxococcales bacterium]
MTTHPHPTSPSHDAASANLDPKKPAVLLLSGGLDSATCLAIAKSEGFDVHALTVTYGQRHTQEVDQARAIARSLGAASHRVVSLDLRAIGGSALTDTIDVPKDDGSKSDGDVPITYVPARNATFLGIALGLAEVLGAADIFIGVNSVDYSGYPDCRPEFIAAFEALADLATRAGVEGTRFKIHAPLQRLSKAQIVQRGIALGVDYGMTHSCYDPAEDGAACGHCDACQLRRAGFASAGVADPTRYAG